MYPVPWSCRVRGVFTRGDWKTTTALNSLFSLKQTTQTYENIAKRSHSSILSVYRFTDCYLGVKLICRHWLQVVPWGCLDLSSPKSGETLNTWGSFSFDSKHSERSDHDWQAIIIEPQLSRQSFIGLKLFLMVAKVITSQCSPVGVGSMAVEVYSSGLRLPYATKPKAEGVSRETQSGHIQVGT